MQSIEGTEPKVFVCPAAFQWQNQTRCISCVRVLVSEQSLEQCSFVERCTYSGQTTALSVTRPFRNSCHQNQKPRGQIVMIKYLVKLCMKVFRWTLLKVLTRVESFYSNRKILFPDFSTKSLLCIIFSDFFFFFIMVCACVCLYGGRGIVGTVCVLYISF